MNLHGLRPPFSLISGLLLLQVLVTDQIVLAEDSSYLQELNSEASEVATFESDEQTQGEDENDSIALQRRKEFETALKNELANTYTIYRKLTNQQKSLVIESYFASGKKISVASRQIFNFYFKEGNR